MTQAETTGWAQLAKLTASDGDRGDIFGESVALAGDGGTALIGARHDEDPNGERAGSAYVFMRDGGSWTQQTRLTPTDGDTEDYFGESVALADDGQTALIGARLDESPNGSGAGAAYVFTRDGESWTQQTKLAAADGDSMDFFGGETALSGDGGTALIAAPKNEDPNGYYAGSAYVFAQKEGSWSQQTKLAPDDGDEADNFQHVALTGDGQTALVGAAGDEDPNGSGAGSAYVFTRDGGSWTQQTKLAPLAGDSEDYFGISVALAGNGQTALVGASQDENPNGSGAGSAYVFTRDGGSWTQQTKLTATDGDSADLFGSHVALSVDGQTAIIGASNDEDPNGSEAGAPVSGAGSTYVFTRDGGSWTQQAKLAPSDGDSGDDFGTVALSGDGQRALIGAHGDEHPNGSGAGAAYVFGQGSNGPTNSPPVPSVTVSPSNPAPGESVKLEAAASTDPDGSIQRYEWDLDDDGNYEQTGQTVTHEFRSSGNQTVTLRVTDDGGLTAVATQTVSVATQPPNRVLTRTDEPVADAEVDAYVTDIRVAKRDRGDPFERHVATTTTDEDGVFELPTDYSDGDRELLVTAQKGDWFTVDRYDPQKIEAPVDYGWLKLDRQRLYGPTVARTDDGAEFGTVSVWRFLFSEDLHVFYIEVTNTNEYDGEDAWRISEASTPGGGPAGGDFLLLFPEDDAHVAEDSAFAPADPTGEGGVHVLGIGPSDTSGESLPELLHPLREYTDVPLYAAMRSQPEEALRQDWHVVTEASSRRARRVSERLKKGLTLPGKVCSKLAGIPCGPGLLITVMEKLTYINRLLEGDRRVATVRMTPNTPRGGGAVVSGTFDVWKPDDVALDTVSIESSVAYQVPVRVETDEPTTYSVRTEWARPFNDLGAFSGTFSTAVIDLAIEQPVGPLTPGEVYFVNVRLRNRSLEPHTIAELTVETPAGMQALTLDETLAPGETTVVPLEGGGFEPRAGTAETQLRATAVTDNGTTVTRTSRIPHEGASAAPSSVSADAAGTPTVEATTVEATTPNGRTDSGGSETTTGSGAGFGMLAALASRSGQFTIPRVRRYLGAD